MNGRWVSASVPEGEWTDSKWVTDANARTLTLIDNAPMPVLGMRRPGRAFKNKMQVDLLPEDLDIEGLTDELPTGLMGLADCVAAQLVLRLSLEARSRHGPAIVQQQAWPCAGM